MIASVKSPHLFIILGHTHGTVLAFRKGLKSLGVLQLVQIFPGQFKEIFVYIDRSITYNTLSDMISSKCPPEGSVDVTVYKWFNQYMKDREGMTYWIIFAAHTNAFLRTDSVHCFIGM